MFSWIGFRQIGVPFVREERAVGEPKYSFRMSLKLALDGLISFSTAPLRFVLTSGFVIALMSFLVGVFAIVARLADYYSLPGWASLLLAISFIGGVQLTVIGVLGLYIERIYNEVKSRPLYVLDESPALGVARREGETTGGPRQRPHLRSEGDGPARTARA